MRHYEHMLQVILDRELADQLDEANRKTMISKSRFVRYAIQPFSYAELSPAPADTDWNDVYRDDPDFDLSDGRRIAVLLTGDEYEMLCRASFKLGITRSAWVRERVYALLRRNYADELSSLTDAGIRDNATQLLKELKARTDGAPPSKKKGRPPSTKRKARTPSKPPSQTPSHKGKDMYDPMYGPMRTHIHTYLHTYRYTHLHTHVYTDKGPYQSNGKQARRIVYTIQARSLPRPAALEQQPECRRLNHQRYTQGGNRWREKDEAGQAGHVGKRC